MQRVTLLCAASAVDSTLDQLRDLGVLHLTPLQVPEGQELEHVRSELERTQRARRAVQAYAPAQPTGLPPAELVAEIERVLQCQDALAHELEELRAEQARLAPFGDFDPDQARALEAAGITVKLCACQGPLPQLPAGTTCTVLRQQKNAVWYAVAGKAPLAEVTATLPLPPRSLRAVEARIAAVASEQNALTRRLAQCAGDATTLQAAVAASTDRVALLVARGGMGSAEKIAYLRGYCPKPKVVEVEAAAAQHGWGLLVEDPAADEEPPTLVQNPPWVRPIQAVFEMIGVVPGYRELDVSPLFLIFLSIFFAMLVGDAGYGAIFLAATWIARRQLPHAPRYPFVLLTIMSVCTIAWGVATGTYFAIQDLPAALTSLRLDWLTDPKNIMLLCFWLGAIHLTLAHGWCALRAINSLQALAQLGWIASTWTMFFLARHMVLGAELPPFVSWLAIAGVVAIVLFMTPLRAFKTEWFNHVMLPLSLVSNFVDVVSYLRLFAVGIAGYEVAKAFNQMALANGFDGVVAGILSSLILLFGHTLNILLSMMGVLVHGVRLNTLEFSSHLGMQWTGVSYAPFARAVRPVRED